MNSKRYTTRHIIIKIVKVKERILKAAREKQLITYKGYPIRLSADFLAEEKEYVKAVYQHPVYLTYMQKCWTGRNTRWNQDCWEKYQ